MEQNTRRKNIYQVRGIESSTKESRTLLIAARDVKHAASFAWEEGVFGFDIGDIKRIVEHQDAGEGRRVTVDEKFCNRLPYGIVDYLYWQLVQ